MSEELKPCPFCGQQDAFVEQLDSDASVVICQGMVDEHSACLARGPVGVQQSEMEDQPGRDAAIAEWNRRAQPAEAEWGGLKLAAEVAEEDGPWEPRLGMTNVETAFAQSASPTKVLELIAALSAVTAERDRLLAELERAYANYNQVSYASTERGKQIDQIRAEVEMLREAFGECIQSLHDEMLQSYGGQKPDDMHPVTRRNYDRDMAEIAEYRAAMAAKEA